MQKEFKQAENTLYQKGFYVANMVYYPECYELTDKDNTVVIDYLSEAQVIQLAYIL